MIYIFLKGELFMKRNILTIVVIALCLINLALSAVIVFSIVPMANRTNDLITQVASVINLELEDPNADSIANNVALSDLETLEPIGEEGNNITANLKKGEDGKAHYAIFTSVTIMINKKAEDYADLKTNITNNHKKVIEIVRSVLTSHTSSEMENDTDGKVQDEVIDKLNEYFGTRGIYDLTIDGLIFQ